MQATATSMLNNEQRNEIRDLARAEKPGTLPDLAERWQVPVRLVAREFADARREITGEPIPAPPVVVHSQTANETLTPARMRIIRMLAEEGRSTRLVGLAVEWGIDERVLNQHYTDARAKVRSQSPQAAPQAVRTVPPTAPAQIPTVEAVSPVAHITAEPGSIGILPKPWRLIQARIAAGKVARDVARAVGMTTAAYNRVEAGAQLPTPDQSARICALLDLPIAETFVAAGHEPPPSGGIRGLSLLGLMRARRRLSQRDMCREVEESTGQPVSQVLIGRIERNELRLPHRSTETAQIQALAQYLQISDEWVTAQVPPDWLQSMAARTAQLHGAFKQAYAALPAGAQDPVLLIGAPLEVIGGE